MKDSLLIANTFLKCGKEEEIDISPMKLQKLIYIFYKEMLQATREKILSERFQVWQYGPVLESVYKEFKKYGSKPIKDYYTDTKNVFYTLDLVSQPVLGRVFERVWATYKTFDGISLSILTHGHDTAWSKALERDELFLSDEDIYEEAPYV